MKAKEKGSRTVDLPRALVDTSGSLPAGPMPNLIPPTAETQARLTPDGVLEDLLAGNARYVAGAGTNHDLAARREATATGQFPKAVVLSCLDSRVPVETIFDQSIGDLFVGRNAGNVANEDQLGSMEFATSLSGARLVMVLGHESCGAVKGACDRASLGHLTQLLEKISPALTVIEGFEPAERNAANSAFVVAAVAANISYQVAQVRSRSPVLKALEDEGRIRVVGAHYALSSGIVSLLPT